MTNVTAGAYADMPLFLFHLLEYLDVDYEIDVDEINERWSNEAADGRLEPARHQGARRSRSSCSPRRPDGHLAARRRRRPHASPLGQRLAQPPGRHGGVLPARAAPGDYRYKGADLGILVTRGRLQTDDNELTERCRRWIEGVRAQFAGTPVDETADPPPTHDALAFKLA